MNSLGLGILFNMGCTCTKESVCINGKRYVVKSRLGEGGFSVVDLVYDANSQRLYALKRIPCHTRESERDAMREAELYKSFDHPNLVRCVDAALVPCHDLSKPFSSEVLILLPYFRRGTLQDELTMRARSRDHMPEPRLLEIFMGMCQGVQAIHSATPVALAHRDLKPANVLLADDDVPVWMDFGSMGRARLDIGRTSEAMALQDLATEKCSMSYRAPELFNVESRTSIDERVDIWSLGCCLYAMCFFRSPFDSAHERGDSVALAVLSGHVDIPPDSPKWSVVCLEDARDEVFDAEKLQEVKRHHVGQGPKQHWVTASKYSGGLHGLIRSMLEVDCLQRPFIESVLEQVTALSASANHKV